MKKIFLLIFQLSSLGLLAQATINPDNYDSINYREYEDSYLLPSIFTDSCATLDIAEINEVGNLTYKMFTRMAPTLSEHIITDLAQPYTTDTMLTVIGVSIFFRNIQYGSMSAYACIIDSNFNIHRQVDIPSYYDEKEFGSYSSYARYSELFFDSAINISGKFYIMIDNPKPYPFLGYNWDSSDRTYCHTELAATSSMLPCNVNSDNWALKRTFYISDNSVIDFTYSDTNWTHITNWDTTKPLFVYMFPIFKEFDSNAEYMYGNPNPVDTSALSSVAVDNYTHIFPNPTSELVTVQCSFKIKTIEVYNSLGQKVEEFSVDGYIKSINTEKYPKDTYIFTIITDNGTTTQKVIVQ